MPATHPILSKRAGEGGAADYNDTLRVQQLLCRAGFLAKSAVNGSWGKGASPTAKAWDDFQRSKGWTPTTYIDPKDPEDRLGYLASAAGVLQWTPDYLRSASALSVFVDFTIASSIPYGWGANHPPGTRIVVGFEKRPNLILFMQPNRQFDINTSEPRSYNCCAFANVLLSVWQRGNIHEAPYNWSQAVGGDGDQLGTRYGMPEIKNSKGNQGISSLDELKGAMSPDRIYHMALCLNSTGTFTKHDTVVVNNMVYQSNTKGASPNSGSVYVQSIDDQWKKMTVKRVRLFGPGPY
ncbi:hypothetical protein F183_A02690 [Bryobacterales bacterium F-183]|nr:hypothetical protein F183_A02690 [Bryobacterales bacterium F-183]